MNKKTRRTSKWLYNIVKKQIKSICFLIVLQIIAALLTVVFALLLKQIVDTATNENHIMFIQFSVLLVCCLVFQVLARLLIRHYEEKNKSLLENHLKAHLFQNIMETDYASIQAYHTGDLANRLSGDITVISEGVTTIIPTAVSMLTKIISALSVLVFIDYRLVLLLIVGGVFLLLFSTMFRKKLKKLHKDMQESESLVRSFLQEMISNLMVIRAFSCEAKVYDEADTYMTIQNTKRMKKAVFSNISQSGFALGMNGAYVFGIIWCGVGIMQGRFTLGTLIAVLQLIGQITQPFANISALYPKYYSMIASSERLIEIEDLDRDKKAKKSTDKEIAEFSKNFKKIIVQGLSFSYSSRENNRKSFTKLSNNSVLSNVNFTLNKGDYVAIVGDSGVGKSTILKLLLFIYQADQGEIHLITEASETIIDNYIDESCRRLFAYVPQGNFLMSGTIGQAITMFSNINEATKLQKVLEIACAKEFVDDLPLGLDTIIGENGAGLSEGQIQRLAVARAILSDAPILLLDEATSALDEETEARMLDNIKNLTDKTVIIVTHRKAALEICNRVFAIENQEIIERSNNNGSRK